MALKGTFRVSRAKILVLIVIFFVLISICNYFIFNFITGYSSHTSKAEKEFKVSLLMLTYKVDSLETEIAKKDTFIQNFKNILKNK